MTTQASGNANIQHPTSSELRKEPGQYGLKLTRKSLSWDETLSWDELCLEEQVGLELQQPGGWGGRVGTGEAM